MGDTDVSVTLTVTDPDGATASDTLSLGADPDAPPSVSLTSPMAGVHYYADQLVTFSGVVADEEDAAEDLVVRWVSSQSGALDVSAPPTSSGAVEGFGWLEAGEQAIQLFATDSRGNESSAIVVVDVGPPNTGPSCVFRPRPTAPPRPSGRPSPSAASWATRTSLRLR
jgi:hypothetical protein